MIKYGEANPLAVFNMRRLDFCPPHFEKLVFDKYVSERAISNWIYENTNSRFYIGAVADSRIKFCVAFESPSETTFFALHLPDINAIR